ncbi:MAG: hypothetical protein V1913_17810 [Fibrobacterota bacterium]
MVRKSFLSTVKPAPLLGVLLFIIFASVILGDNTSDSLLLANYDTTIIPYMFIANAVLLFVISLFFITLIDKKDRGRLMMGVLAVHFLALLGIRFLVDARVSFVFPLLYSYAYSAKMILFLTFWTMANDIISAREAKAAFPLIAAGGITGGILISFSVVFLMKIIPAEELLLCWAGLAFLALPLTYLVHRRFYVQLKAATSLPGRERRGLQLANDFRMIRNETLLKNMAFIYFLTFILLFAHDYLFLSTLKQSFQAAGAALPLKKAIPTFLGYFKGASNLVTILLQVTIAGFLLKKLGTVRSALVMPVVFLLTYTAVLLSLLGILPAAGPGGYPFYGSLLFTLIAGSIALRIAVFDSIYSPNFQIFFSALGKEIRGRGKIFIEGIVKPVAIVAAGGLIIGLFSWSILLSVCVLLFLSLVLLWRCLSMRRTYSESIFRSLGGNRLSKIQSLLDLQIGEEDESVVEILEEVLDDPDPEVSDFAVTYLAQLKGDRARRLLRSKQDQAEGATRARLIELLGALKDPRFWPYVEAGLSSDEPRILAAALTAVHRSGAPVTRERLIPFLAHRDPDVFARTVLALWKRSDDQGRLTLRATLEARVHSADEAAVRAALEACGEIADPLLVPLLLAQVPKADAYRITVIEKGLSNGALTACEEHMHNALGHRDRRVRRMVVRVIAREKDRLSREVKSRLASLAEAEIQRLYRYWQYSEFVRHEEGGDAASVYADLIRDNLITRNYPYVVTLLHTLSNSGHLLSVADKVLSANKHVRANALELVENNVDGRLAGMFLPLCETADPRSIVEHGKNEWKFEDVDIYFVLKDLAGNSDPWVCAFTLYYAIEKYRRTGQAAFLDAVRMGEGQAVAALRELVYGQ